MTAISSTTSATASRCARRSPRATRATRDGYSAFVDYTKRVFQKGYTELAATPFLRFFDMVRVAPQLARLRADRSVYDTVARFVHDEHVREALSFHSLLVGGNPFDTSAIYTLIHYLERRWGVCFPRGGTGALVERAGRACFRSSAASCACRPRCARFASSRAPERAPCITSRTDAPAEEAFDLVVSNADLHHTYAKLYQGVEAAEQDRGQARARGLVDVALRALFRHRHSRTTWRTTP